MTNAEQNILRDFFEKIGAMGLLDSSISDTKPVRDTRNKLKAALRNVEHRCTCAKRTWGGPCEVCQASSHDLFVLRNFFRVIRDSKKNGWTAPQIQEFIENMKKQL
ncbi:MAG TPA: hypothetical protein VGG27_18875 [Magnetospirillaceae bacterium]|jgi:hypothetical protein